MEKSRLPVSRHQPQKSSELLMPSAKKTFPPKQVLPLYSKDPNIAFSSTIPDFTMNKDGISGRKNFHYKKTVPLARGQATRNKMESELRDQNLLLEAANGTLNSRLRIAQGLMQCQAAANKAKLAEYWQGIKKGLTPEIKQFFHSTRLKSISKKSQILEMSENQDTTQKELKELKRRLENNLLILESRNIDPVSGEQILADAEETRNIREKTKTARENLIKELERFSLTTKEQTELVKTVKAKWEEDKERRNQFLEEQKAFQTEMDEFRSALQQAEQDLDL